MRILFLSDNFPPESNAPASRLYEHARHWVAQGHEVTVITCAPNFPEGKVFRGYRNAWRHVATLDGIRVVRVKTFITANEGFLRRTLDYVSFMASASFFGLFERAPDVVVATSPQFFTALGGWALSAVRRRPFVFELRDLWPASIVAVGAMQKRALIRGLEVLELFLYDRAELVVAVTESFREDLIARGVAPEKIEVVRNGADLSWCRPHPKDMALATEFNLQDKFVVGYLGTHGMAHGLGRILDAAETLLDRPEIALFFAGSGAERSNLERWVRERRLENVRMIPRQPKERVSALWSLCDLALIPLRDSPVFATVIPSKLFEAMGHGVPVLMSLPEGEATRIVHETGCGVCVPPEDSAAIAAVIRQLADDRTRLRHLAMCARAAAPSYSRETQANLMARLLVGLSGSERSSSANSPSKGSRLS